MEFDFCLSENVEKIQDRQILFLRVKILKLDCVISKSIQSGHLRKKRKCTTQLQELYAWM